MDRRVTLDGVDNFRDFGGYAGADGRRLKLGRLFRSASHGRATDDDLEVIAKEAAAEHARRKLRDSEMALSKEREKKALWMRVHGKAAGEQFNNFMTGVVQATASRSVLRWFKGHRPYGGTNPSSGGDWTDEELYAAEQACYAGGHVPPWHIDGAQCAATVSRTPAAMGVYRSR